MKRTLLTMALALAMLTGAKAQVLPLLPSAHGLTENQPAYAAQPQQQTQEINLANGWNWWSSYVDLSDNGLSMLETALAGNASAIKSQTNINYCSSGVWAGNLEEISNDRMYMIQMASIPSDAMEMTAAPLETSNVTINTSSGWTWIGFPSNQVINLTNSALVGFTPQEGNAIKSQNEISYYTDGAWEGTLEQFVPGKGYMIQGSAQQFHFASAQRSEVLAEEPQTFWTSSYHDFPTNMNILAVVNLMGEELRSNNYEVAAFAGNDCRGTINPKFVESVNRNIAFMTISGNDGDRLRFFLRDNETGDVYAASNVCTYNTNEIIGSPKNPYVLYFNTLMSNDEFMVGKMDMFPNPVKQDGMLTLSIPALGKNMKVQVINSLGMVVKSENMNAEKTNLSVNLAPGVYTVKVVAGDKQLYVEKLIVE